MKHLLIYTLLALFGLYLTGCQKETLPLENTRQSFRMAVESTFPDTLEIYQYYPFRLFLFTDKESEILKDTTGKRYGIILDNDKAGVLKYNGLYGTRQIVPLKFEPLDFVGDHNFGFRPLKSGDNEIKITGLDRDGYNVLDTLVINFYVKMP